MLFYRLKPINLLKHAQRNFHGISKELEANLRQKYEMKDSSLDRYLEEKVILVNKTDDEVGNLSLLESHLTDNVEAKDQIHRAFSVFVFNQHNELLMQQRSATKMAFPLEWTNSCCSHPLHSLGENIDKQDGTEKAAIRRLFDEQNLKEKQEDLRIVDKIYYKALANEFFTENEIDYIFLYKRQFENNKIDFNTREVNDIAWVKREEFDTFYKEKLNKKEGFTPWFELIRKKGMIEHYWDKVIKNDIPILYEKNLNIVYFS